VLGRIVRRRSGAAEGAVRAIESLAFYGFLALFFLVALRTVNIPLTAFALAGGALAVGVGFGSQAIVNNFISGLILLTERPIQIGDIIELDGTQGVVERIGPRSTRIKTFEGVHLIVPNSAFLERNVLNLTLSDDLVRGSVEVGVGYGSDPRRVEEILERVLHAHPQVLDDPAPGIELAAFGESALLFKTFLWVRDVTLRGKVASDVRYQLVDELAKAGIELAYPQRDVHLDARKPLAVQVVRGDGGPDKEG
jgi:small-conductance mechanosensitive channel